MSATTPVQLDVAEEKIQIKQRSLWGDVWIQFRKHKLAMAGMIVLTGIMILAFF